MEFSPFHAYAPQDLARLEAQICLCARLGRSYEFADCALPAGCTPRRATVGFWQTGGGFLLYVRPAIRYEGRNAADAALFQRGQLAFPTFGALAAFLGADRAEQAAADGLVLLRRALGQAVVGQEEAVDVLARSLFAHIGKTDPARPLSLIFYGPTGVGKSELGKHVAPALDRLCGEGSYQFVWTELNTFTEPHSVYRLTGAPPGYVGYDDAPVFEAVLRNPRTVFMFDELDKAHPEILKSFMSILDEGRCAARRELGTSCRELDFRRCVFLFTTNADLSKGDVRLGFRPPAAAGGERAWEEPAAAGTAARLFYANERGRRAMFRSGALREIAGRFSGFVEFLPLEPAALRQIAARQVAALGEEYGLRVASVAPELLDAIGAGTAGAFSARSNRGMLEGCFSALFLEHAALRGIPLRLEGPLTGMRLVPDGPAPAPCASPLPVG